MESAIPPDTYRLDPALLQRKKVRTTGCCPDKNIFENVQAQGAAKTEDIQHAA